LTLPCISAWQAPGFASGNPFGLIPAALQSVLYRPLVL
jgi:hypothetical protein